MADAVKDNGVVFQTGSQQRSEYGGNSVEPWKCRESGAIGELKKIRVCVGGPPKPADSPTEPTPGRIDWGCMARPAPMRGFNKILCPDDVHNHFPHGVAIANTAMADLPTWVPITSILDNGLWTATTQDLSKSFLLRKESGI